MRRIKFITVAEVVILGLAIWFLAKTVHPQTQLQTIRFKAAAPGYGTMLPADLRWADSRHLIMLSCDGKGFLRADTVTGTVELHIAIGYNSNFSKLDWPIPADSGVYMVGDHNTTVYGVRRASNGDILLVPGPYLLIPPGTSGQLRYSNPATAASAYLRSNDPETGTMFPPATGWTMDFDGEPSFTNRNFIITGPSGPTPTPTVTITPGGPTWTPTQTSISPAATFTPTPSSVRSATATPGGPTPTPNPCPPGFPCGTPGPTITPASTPRSTPTAVPSPTPTPIVSPCGPASPIVLCLQGRFKVSVTFGGGGPERVNAATASSFNSTTGYFWFFAPDNAEVFVKVLDGCAVNGKWWVFAAGLTNVQTAIRVEDVKTGSVNLYASPPNVAFAPLQDTTAFEGLCR